MLLCCSVVTHIATAFTPAAPCLFIPGSGTPNRCWRTWCAATSQGTTRYAHMVLHMVPPMVLHRGGIARSDQHVDTCIPHSPPPCSRAPLSTSSPAAAQPQSAPQPAPLLMMAAQAAPPATACRTGHLGSVSRTCLSSKRQAPPSGDQQQSINNYNAMQAVCCSKPLAGDCSTMAAAGCTPRRMGLL